MGYKVQKIYVGTQQVRPGPLYQYEYDFRNKSVSQLNADGITILTGSPSFSSNGMYGSLIRATKAIPSIATANKITIKYRVYTGSYGGWAFGIGKTITASTRDGISRIFNNKSNALIDIYDTNLGSWSVSGNGYIDAELVYDFVNKTYTFNYTGLATKTGSITDAQIANVRTYTTGMFIYSDTGSYTDGGLISIYLLIQ